MSKQLQLEKIVQEDHKSRKQLLWKNSTRFWREQENETNFRKMFPPPPKCFCVYLIQARFCKEKLHLTRLTLGIWSIYPQRHFLKMRKNKGGNLPACAFHTSFLGQHQEWQYSSTSFSASLSGPCSTELINCIQKGC